VIAPVWTNCSCDLFTSADTPCNLGNYVYYSINITKPAHIAAGLCLARKHNVRLVAQNIGRDYLGRSMGAGSLAVWTHYLKGIEHTTKYKGTPADQHSVEARCGCSGI